jgi:hypothetical protein
LVIAGLTLKSTQFKIIFLIDKPFGKNIVTHFEGAVFWVKTADGENTLFSANVGWGGPFMVKSLTKHLFCDIKLIITNACPKEITDQILFFNSAQRSKPLLMIHSLQGY